MSDSHQCEAWQILVNADGTSRYCGACGKTCLLLTDFHNDKDRGAA